MADDEVIVEQSIQKTKAHDSHPPETAPPAVAMATLDAIIYHRIGGYQCRVV